MVGNEYSHHFGKPQGGGNVLAYSLWTLHTTEIDIKISRLELNITEKRQNHQKLVKQNHQNIVKKKEKITKTFKVEL